MGLNVLLDIVILDYDALYPIQAKSCTYKFVEQPTGPAPDLETADPDTIDKYYETVNLEQEVACLMLLSMSPDLQRTLEKYNAYDMLKELKTMFEEQAKHELFKIVKAFHACKQEEGQSVSSYLLKMKSYLDTLECLFYVIPNELGVTLILNSVNKDYDQFVQNYNMHNMGKTIAELHVMPKLHKKGIPKKAETLDVLNIREGKIQKDKRKPQGANGKDKGKNKLVYTPKAKIPPSLKRFNSEKDSVCHHCKEVGHWRRNCSSYQVELKKRKNASMGSTSCIFTIELYAFPNKTWVYDTGCGTHICNTLQGLRRSKNLKHGALSLYMGNGMHATIEAIGSFDLILPSGLIIVLDNSTKEKYSLGSYYLWHCRLGHINKKRMDKLQRDGILQSTHDESLEKCKSCIIRKMERNTFPHQVESAKDLLGLIHTNVCGPFRIVSREGASYFITFTDDFSRYGYVYLMKHKHEVSEMRNQTLLDMVRSMMNLTTLPKSFWGYALESATRILNMVPTKKVERTPYEIWHGKAPKLSYLRVCGYEALVKQDAHDKLDPRSIKCIFVGYLKETIGYYFYYPLENKIFVARNAKFSENSLIVQEANENHGLLKTSRSDERLESIQEEDTKPSENTSEEHNEVVPIDGILMNLLIIKAALSDLEYDEWIKAMNMKMQFMKDNQVWILVELPPNGRTVRSKWLYKKKTNMDGDVHIFKARLVAKGYTQTYGVDYGETFSPVANIIVIRILLAIAAFHDYEIWQMNVKTAFLNEKILKRFRMENSKKGYTPMMEKPDYRKSQGAKTPSEVFVLNGGVVKWKSAKQSTTAMCSTEAEYIATAEASTEAVWMMKFIDGLDDVVPSNKRPMEMLCDNVPTIAIAADPDILKGAKHFQRKYHYIHEVIQER
nr:zinc finger, CCHC-type [Tanacetum cinerariifolium]